MNENEKVCTCKSTPPPRGKSLIDNYSQRSLALLIPGSRLNARNSPGAHPYCNHQSLKKFCGANETAKNLTPQKVFTQIIFSMKISRSTVSPKLQLIIYLKQVTVQQCMSRTREVALDILTQQMNSTQ